MSFYLKPCGGTISLNKLTSYALRRTEFLQKIYSTNGDRIKLHDVVTDFGTVSQSDCLIAGTQKDSISHFIIRFILSQDEDASAFMYRAEKMLFDLRCSCMTVEELYRLLKSLNKFQDFTKQRSSRNHELLPVLSALFHLKASCKNSWKSVAKKYFSCNLNDHFEVPFNMILPLVAKRQVVIKTGVAFVPFEKLLVFLGEVFSYFLHLGIKQASRQQLTDFRIHQISNLVLNKFAIWFHQENILIDNNFYLSHDEIDSVSERFPPCMLHLHTVLRERHRLNHHARIQYSLFLKEIGVPLHQSVIFWRKEYSKPSLPGLEWGHDWQTDSGRYIYSVRHLYGLEGSKKNYRGHCCQSLQNQSIQPSCVGGCPFVHFDSSSLQDFLSTHCLSNTESIMSLTAQERFNDACMEYMKSKIEENVNCDGTKQRYSTLKKNFLPDTILVGHCCDSGMCACTDHSFIDVDSKMHHCDKIKLNTSSSLAAHSHPVSQTSVVDNKTNVGLFISNEGKRNDTHPWNISKPVDYFTSYTTMIESLKQL